MSFNNQKNQSKITPLLLVLILGGMASICYTSCNQSQEHKIHFEVQSAMKFIEQTDLLAKAKKLTQFKKELSKESYIQQLAINFEDKHVFAMSSGKFLDAIWDPDKQKLNNVNSSVWSASELSRIEYWIVKCEEYDVCGFDLRDIPETLRIFVRLNVYIMFLSERTSMRAREHINATVKKKFDPRGDVFYKLSNDIYVATERR